MLVPEKHSYKKYRTIECPWVTDILQEKFDDAMSMLSEECVIYGGAVRDIFANLPISGDLDIAIPQKVFRGIDEKFRYSSRWMDKVGQLSFRTRTDGGSANPTTTKKIISKVNTYHNNNGDTIQLIAPELNHPHGVQGVAMELFDIVLNVDIVCCGILSNIFGTVYEVLPGAIQDCKDKVLRFNNEIKVTKTSLKKLANRIAKLEKRGWTNKINISKIKTIKEMPTTEPKAPSNVFGGSEIKF